MGRLKLRVKNAELDVEGCDETIRQESEAFYQYVSMEEKSGTDSLVRSCGELQATWGEIASAINSGSEIKTGDYKKGRTVSGQAFTMVVTDVTDEYVRFESRDCVGGEVEWNKNDDTKSGYLDSDIHKYLNKELFEQLPEDLRNVISLGERKTLRNGEVVTFNTYLFLPAASEVFEEDSCYGDEGLYGQMEYYKDRRNRMRGTAEGEDTDTWWLASARSGISTYACYVNSDGYANNWSASYATRVPVCFIIKKS